MNTWKINKNDISYRFLSRWCNFIPQDFCGYYRKIALVVLGLFLGGFVVGNALMGPVYYVLGVSFPNDHITSFASLMFFISFLTWASAIVTGGICLYYYIKDMINDWRENNDYLYDSEGNYIGRKPKKQSIIKTWYKAYKGKFCPMIEFEDEAAEDLTLKE